MVNLKFDGGAVKVCIISNKKKKNLSSIVLPYSCEPVIFDCAEEKR